MLRWIAVLSSLMLLAGCVTTREVVYRDGYSYTRDGYAERRYYDADGNYYYDDDRRYEYRDGSYYSPSYAGRGDYYAGSSYGHGYDTGYDSWAYWDYPAYYSVFWPMYRSWYDPYWYPSYYYGVTYYPRSYFSLSFGSGWGRPYYSHWYYSPYRYSWVDNYYDWSPWHGYRHSHRDWHHSPRYGSSRNEAERLARLGGGRYRPSLREDAVGGRYGNRYGEPAAGGRYGRPGSTDRGADYRTAPTDRQAPAVGAFGVPTARPGLPSGNVRRDAVATGRDDRVPVDANARRSGQVNGYEPLPERPPAATRGYDASGDYNRRYSSDDRRPATREANQYRAVPRGEVRRYDDGVALPRQSMSRPAASPSRVYTPAGNDRRAVSRGYTTESAPSMPTRRVDAAPIATDRSVRRYEAAPAPVYSAPRREPSFDARAQPRYEPRAEPRYEARPEPRFESRQESRQEPARFEAREDRGSNDRDSGGSRREATDRDDRR
jgi:hypothetical protein